MGAERGLRLPALQQRPLVAATPSLLHCGLDSGSLEGVGQQPLEAMVYGRPLLYLVVDFLREVGGREVKGS